MSLWSSTQAWQLGGQNLSGTRTLIYFLTEQDEWYKAAYHQNDGVTANYWDYATGCNSLPLSRQWNRTRDCCLNRPGGAPAAVQQQRWIESYGTRGQNGNVWEWTEVLLMSKR
jgi:hypothetical protein